MNQEYQLSIKKSDWHYISLQLIFDPQSLQNDSNKDDLNNLTIDSITWKSIILSSLNKLYGIIGESHHFDILQTSKCKSIIRIQNEDKEIFINSLLAITFQLSKYIGSNAFDTNCYIKVNKNADYLGLVVDECFYE